MNKFNGITIQEFKKIAPEYENIEGEVLWNKMEDYVLMLQKYEDAEDSRYMKYIYPSIIFDDNNTSDLKRILSFGTYLRIFSRLTGFYYIVNYRSDIFYDLRQANSEHFIIDFTKQFMQKCYDEIYNMLHFYLIDDKQIIEETGKPPYTFDIYQGSEYHRLKWIKERNEPGFFKDNK